MSDEPTPAEVERARRWSKLQTPPVTVVPYGPSMFQLSNVPKWLKDTKYRCMSEDIAWSVLALALRPVFASVAPIVREEFERFTASKIDNADYSGDDWAVKAYMDGWNGACRWIRDNAAAAIRAMS